MSAMENASNAGSCLPIFCATDSSRKINSQTGDKQKNWKVKTNIKCHGKMPSQHMLPGQLQSSQHTGLDSPMDAV